MVLRAVHPLPAPDHPKNMLSSAGNQIPVIVFRRLMPVNLTTVYISDSVAVWDTYRYNTEYICTVWVLQFAFIVPCTVCALELAFRVPCTGDLQRAFRVLYTVCVLQLEFRVSCTVCIFQLAFRVPCTVFFFYSLRLEFRIHRFMQETILVCTPELIDAKRHGDWKLIVPTLKLKRVEKQWEHSSMPIRLP